MDALAGTMCLIAHGGSLTGSFTPLLWCYTSGDRVVRKPIQGLGCLLLPFSGLAVALYWVWQGRNDQNPSQGVNWLVIDFMAYLVLSVFVASLFGCQSTVRAQNSGTGLSRSDP